MKCKIRHNLINYCAPLFRLHYRAMYKKCLYIKLTHQHNKHYYAGESVCDLIMEAIRLSLTRWGEEG